MTDIAPLGFSVDTSALDNAARAGQAAANDLNKVADAADRVSESSGRASPIIKGGSDSLKEHASQAEGAATALGHVSDKAKEAGDKAKEHGEAVKKATDALKEGGKATDEHAKAIDALKKSADGLLPSLKAVTDAHVDMAKKSSESLRSAATDWKALQAQAESTHAAMNKAVTSSVMSNGGLLGLNSKTFGANIWHGIVTKGAEMKGLVDPGTSDSFWNNVKGGDGATQEAQKHIAQLEKVIQTAGKMFDAKRLTEKQYNDLLERAGASMDGYSASAAEGGHPGGNAHHRTSWNPLYQFGRTAFSGVPGFSRIGSAISSEAVSGGGMGALAGAAGLGLAGGIGLLAAQGIGMVLSQLRALPKNLADAGEEAQKLELRLDAFGTGGGAKGIERMRDAASDAGAKFKEFAADVEALDRTFFRFQSSHAQNINLTKTIEGAGRLSGLNVAESSKTVQQAANLFDKTRVSGADLYGLESASPALVGSAAAALGKTRDQLMALANDGKLTGQMLADGILKSSPEIQKRLAAAGDTMEQSANRASNAWSKAFEDMDKTFGASRFYKMLNDAQGNIARGAVEWSAAFAAVLGIQGGNDGDQPKGKGKGAGGAGGKAAATATGSSSFLKDWADTGQLYEGDASIQDRRDEAIKKLGELRQKQANGEASLLTITDPKDRQATIDALNRIKILIPEVQRAAEGMRTPYQQLTKDVQSFGQAMEQGGGGAAAMWREANQQAEQQAHEGAAAIKTAQQFLELLKQRARLEAELEISNRANETKNQQALASATMDGGINGDSLRTQSDAEAATWAFQKFGDQIDKNDALVRKYADSLYSLKLALRDASDAGETKAMDRENAAKLARLRSIQAGDDPAVAERAARDARLAFEQNDRNTSAIEATKGATYRTKGYSGYEGSSGAGGAVYSASGLDAGVMAGERSRDDQVSSAGARGRYQVLPSTARNPGYGVAPANDNSVAEFNRVGHDLIAALTQHYGGDQQKAYAAYNWGRGNSKKAGVDTLVAKYGDGWLAHAPKDVQQYVSRATGATGAAGVGGLADQTVSVPGTAGRAAGPSDANIGYIDAKGRGYAYDDLTAISQEAATAKKHAEDTRALVGATATGDPLKRKDAELEQKVQDMKDRYKGAGFEDQRKNAEEQIRAADAADRELRAAEELGAIRKNHSDMEDELGLLKYGTKELEIQRQLLDERHRLQGIGIDPNGDQGRGLLNQKEAAAREEQHWRDTINRVEDLKGAWSEFTQGAGKSLIEMFDTAFTKGRGMGQAFLKSLGDAGLQLFNRLMNNVVVNPLMKALEQIGNSVIGSIMGGLGGGHTGGGALSSSPVGSTGLLSGNALGNAFNAGNVVPFALGGGIARTPTRMAMANGGTALIGEAGDEAVMPLKRGADGRLGVAASGGGGGGGSNVTVIDQRTQKGSEPIQVEERKSGNGQRDLQIMVRDSVRTSFRSGEFDMDQKTQFGVSRTVARR